LIKPPMIRQSESNDVDAAADELTYAHSTRGRVSPYTPLCPTRGRT
jgi:hypothetical protein